MLRRGANPLLAFAKHTVSAPKSGMRNLVGIILILSDLGEVPDRAVGSGGVCGGRVIN